MRTAIKIIEHAHRVVSEFSLRLQAGLMCKWNLFLSPFMLRRPQHLNQNIFSLRNSERESEKRVESSGKTKFSNIFRHYFICFASLRLHFFHSDNGKRQKPFQARSLLLSKWITECFICGVIAISGSVSNQSGLCALWVSFAERSFNYKLSQLETVRAVWW